MTISHGYKDDNQNPMYEGQLNIDYISKFHYLIGMNFFISTYFVFIHLKDQT